MGKICDRWNEELRHEISEREKVQVNAIIFFVTINNGANS